MNKMNANECRALNAKTISECCALVRQQDFTDRIWGLCMPLDLLEEAETDYDKSRFAGAAVQFLNSKPNHWLCHTPAFQQLREQIKQDFGF